MSSSPPGEHPAEARLGSSPTRREVDESRLGRARGLRRGNLTLVPARAIGAQPRAPRRAPSARARGGHGRRAAVRAVRARRPTAPARRRRPRRRRHPPLRRGRPTRTHRSPRLRTERPDAAKPGHHGEDRRRTGASRAGERRVRRVSVVRRSMPRPGLCHVRRRLRATHRIHGRHRARINLRRYYCRDGGRGGGSGGGGGGESPPRRVGPSCRQTRRGRCSEVTVLHVLHGGEAQACGKSVVGGQRTRVRRHFVHARSSGGTLAHASRRGAR